MHSVISWAQLLCSLQLHNKMMASPTSRLAIHNSNQPSLLCNNQVWAATQQGSNRSKTRWTTYWACWTNHPTRIPTRPSTMLSMWWMILTRPSNACRSSNNCKAWCKTRSKTNSKLIHLECSNQVPLKTQLQVVVDSSPNSLTARDNNSRITSRVVWTALRVKILWVASNSHKTSGLLHSTLGRSSSPKMQPNSLLEAIKVLVVLLSKTWICLPACRRSLLSSTRETPPNNSSSSLHFQMAVLAGSKALHSLTATATTTGVL